MEGFLLIEIDAIYTRVKQMLSSLLADKVLKRLHSKHSSFKGTVSRYDAVWASSLLADKVLKRLHSKHSFLKEQSQEVMLYERQVY